MSSLRWRPVLPVAALSHKQANACFAGGEALAIVWMEDRWVAFRDRCPHRGAPLSQGRVVRQGWLTQNQALECAFHGWQWDREGRVLAGKNCQAAKHATATTFPLMEAGGMLWAAVAAGGQAPSEIAAPSAEGSAALEEPRPLQPPGHGLPQKARPWTRWSLWFPADAVRALVLADGGFEAIAPDLFLGPSPNEALALLPLGPAATEVVALGPAGLKPGLWPEATWWGKMVGPARRRALQEEFGLDWRLDGDGAWKSPSHL